MTDSPPAPSRASRWGLFLPFIVFGLICLGWTAYWFIARSVVLSGIDREIEQAAARGDSWTCANRSVAGYPFRLEISCDSLALARTASAGVVAFRTGPLLVIGQPMTPHHVIIQTQGPATGRLADGTAFEARWDRLEASRRAPGGELERFSLDSRKPVVVIGPQTPQPVTLSAQQLEFHLVRNPTRAAQERALDAFLKVTQLASAQLDTLLGDQNPSDIEIQAVIGRADLLAHGLAPVAIEQWRQQQGKIEFPQAVLKKGVKRIEAKGQLTLDEQRRIAGRIEPAVANLDQIAGIRLRGGAMDFMSALAGRGGPAADGLRPLPALEMKEGRIALGPLRIPALRLDPLY